MAETSVTITATLKDVVTAPAKAIQGALGGVKGVLDGLSSALGPFSNKLTQLVSAFLSFEGIKKAMAWGREAEESMRKLQIAAHGNVAEFGRLRDAAEKLAAQTTWSDDEIAKVEALGIQFGFARRQIQDFTVSVLGLAATTGEPVEGIARQLRMLALSDAGAARGSLKALGVQVLMNKDGLVDLDATLARTARDFFIFAQAAAKSPFGRLTREWNRFQDAIEPLGLALAELANRFLPQLVDAGLRVVEVLSSPEVQGILTVVTDLVARFTIWLPLVFAITAGMMALGFVITAVTTVVGAAVTVIGGLASLIGGLPIIIAAAVVAISGIVISIETDFDRLSEGFATIVTGIGLGTASIGDLFRFIWNTVKITWNRVRTDFILPLEIFVKWAFKIAMALSEFVSSSIIAGFLSIKDTFTSVFGWIADKFVQIFGGIAQFLGTVFGKVFGWIAGQVKALVVDISKLAGQFADNFQEELRAEAAKPTGNPILDAAQEAQAKSFQQLTDLVTTNPWEAMPEIKAQIEDETVALERQNDELVKNVKERNAQALAEKASREARGPGGEELDAALRKLNIERIKALDVQLGEFREREAKRTSLLVADIELTAVKQLAQKKLLTAEEYEERLRDLMFQETAREKAGLLTKLANLETERKAREALSGPEADVVDILQEQIKTREKLEDLLDKELDTEKELVRTLAQYREELRLFAIEKQQFVDDLAQRSAKALGKQQLADIRAFTAQQQKEMTDAIERFGPEIADQMQAILDLETARFRGISVLQELGREEAIYRETLERTNAMHEQGILTLSERNRAIEEATASYVLSVQVAITNIEDLAQSNDELAASLQPVLEKLQLLRAELDRQRDTWASFQGSFLAGMLEVSGRMNELAELGREVGRALAEGLSSGIASGVQAIASGAESASVAFRKMAQSVIQDIARIMIQWAVMRAITGLLGGFTAGGGAVGTAAAGSFAGGGLIPGRETPGDSLLIAARPHEYIVRPEAVRRYGLGFFNALNAMLLPRELFVGLGSGVGRHAGVAFAEGGQVGSVAAGAGGAGVSRAVLVANEEGFDKLLAGGGNAMLRWLSANRSAIRGAIG